MRPEPTVVLSFFELAALLDHFLVSGVQHLVVRIMMKMIMMMIMIITSWWAVYSIVEDDDSDGEGESGDLMLSKLLDKVSNPTLLALLSFSSLFLSVMSLEALSSDSFDFSLASDDALDAGFTPSLAV